MPPGHGDDDFAAKGGGSCAWHSRAWNNNIINVRFYPYITLPYQPDARPGCAYAAVNGGFDFSGHGVFDGVSVVAGHEWAETLTDPRMDAWYDDIWNNLNKDGGETGDKCMSPKKKNIGVAGDYYAVQALWSNADGGCVLPGVPTADQTPPSSNMGAVIRYYSSSPLTVQLTNNGDLDLPLVPINKSPWYLTGVNVKDFSLANNTCGSLLHPGSSCQVDVTFRPLEFGTRQATLAVNIQGGVPHTGNATPLSGEGVPQWAIFDQGIVVFGGKLINSGSSAPLTLNLANTGTATQTIAGVSLAAQTPPEFSIVRDGCSGHPLGPSASCPIVLGFAPLSTGERNAELRVADAAGVGFGVPLEGTGLGPIGELSSTELVFDEIRYDSAGGAPGSGEIPVSGETQQDVTFSNVGQADLSVSGVEVTGDFVLEASDCTQALPPGGLCTLRVRMRPLHFADQSGALLVYDNTGESPHQARLTGEINAASASFTLDALQFDPVPVGVRSAPKMVEFENREGEAPLHIQSITATGDFSATSNCPALLALGRCSITVSMRPTATGTRRGMLVVTDDAPRSPHQIPLDGKACGGDPDCGGDGVPDAADNCPFFPNASQTDADGNHRGDACECGDQDGNGRVDVSDLIAINQAIFSPALASPLCDANDDQLCNVNDIVAANRTIFVPKSSICTRQPVPGP